MGSGHGQATEDCCFRPSFPIPGLIFALNACCLRQAVLHVPSPRGRCCVPPPSCEGRPSFGPRAGLNLGWGGARGPVCEGHCSPCLRLSRLLWLLFLCGYLLQVALCQTHSVTHVHTRLPTWTLTSGLSECVEVGEPVILGVKFAMTGWGGVRGWGSHGSQRRLTKVLGRLSHLGTPFQFLVLETSLETVSCLPGWRDLRIR